MTDGGDESIVMLRLVLASLDDDPDPHARHTAIDVIAGEVGPNAERWREIAIRSARMAALFAATVHGSPADPETRAMARAVVQTRLTKALDQHADPGT